MALKISFDIYEAALLLNVFLTVESEQVKRFDLLTELSKQLRQKYVNSGIEVDESFRNIKGLQSQYCQMERAWKDSSENSNCHSQIFCDIVNLYRSDPTAYEKTLREAKKMAGISNEGQKVWDNTQEGFIAWLQANKPGLNAANTARAIADGENFAKRQGMRFCQLFGASPDKARMSCGIIRISRAFSKQFLILYRNYCYAAEEYERFLDALEKQEEASTAASAPEEKPAPAKAEAVTKPVLSQQSTMEADGAALVSEQRNLFQQPLQSAPAVSLHEEAAPAKPTGKELLTVDFDNLGTYAHTQPLFVLHSGRKIRVSTWADVYRLVLEKLAVRDQVRFEALKGKKTKLGSYLFGSEKEKKFMSQPVLIIPDFYAETKLSITKMVWSIPALCEFFKVDCHDFWIEYVKVEKEAEKELPKQETAKEEPKPIEQPAPEEPKEEPAPNANIPLQVNYDCILSSYEGTRPLGISYRSNKKTVRSWQEVYRVFLEKMAEEFPLETRYFKGKKAANGSLLFGTAIEARKMWKPANINLPNFFAELNLDVPDMLKIMKEICAFCSINPMEFEIEYEKTDDSPEADIKAEPVKQEKSVPQPETATPEPVMEPPAPEIRQSEVQPEPEAVPNSPAEQKKTDARLEVKAAFLDWLKKNPNTAGDWMIWYGKLTHVLKYLEFNEKISLFNIHDQARLRMLRMELAAKGSYRTGVDRSALKALDLYIDFIKERSRRPASAPEEPISVESAPAPVLPRMPQEEQKEPAQMPKQPAETVENAPPVPAEAPQPEPAAEAPRPVSASSDPDLQKVLSEKFGKGYRKASNLDMRKLRTFWKDMYGTDCPEEDDDRLKLRIAALCIDTGDRWYLPEALLSEDDRRLLEGEMTRFFDGARHVLYIAALYDQVHDQLSNTLLTPELFDQALRAAYGGRYIFSAQYLSDRAGARPDIAGEIRDEMEAEARPMSVDRLCARLPHLPREKVEEELKTNPAFICNSYMRSGDREYFHEDMLQLTADELQGAADIISGCIIRDEYAARADVLHRIEVRLPELAERMADYSAVARWEILSRRLGSRFTFTSSAACTLGRVLCASDLLTLFCRKNCPFTWQDYCDFANEIGARSLMKYPRESAFRVSETEFVDKDSIVIPVDQADAALSLFCPGPYAALVSIRNFDAFPFAGHPWNAWLLEQYVLERSHAFRLCYGGNYAASGIIVRADSGLQEGEELLALILADSGIELKQDTALDWLSENGYIDRKTKSWATDSILRRARTIREERE